MMAIARAIRLCLRGRFAGKLENSEVRSKKVSVMVEATAFADPSESVPAQRTSISIQTGFWPAAGTSTLGG